MAQKLTPNGLEVGLFIEKPKPQAPAEKKEQEAPKAKAPATKRKTK